MDTTVVVVAIITFVLASSVFSRENILKNLNDDDDNNAGKALQSGAPG